MLKELESVNIENIEREISEYFNQKKPIALQTSDANMCFADDVNKVLLGILKKKNFQHLRSPLSFIFKEFIFNANKANLKRVFFRLNCLNINLPQDYEDGMRDFPKAMREEIFKISSYLDDYKKYVKVIFQEYTDKEFVFYIINNSQLTDNEKIRIQEKIKLYSEINQDENALFNILDETEGAGMGLFLSLKLMKQFGIDNKGFKIGVHEDKTITKLSFDFTKISPPPYSEIAKEILNELKTLPKFPDTIKNLLTKLLHDDITAVEVAEDVSRDPTLSADLLKLVNSAQFSLNRKIASIKEAINLVGLKGLKNLLYSYGAMHSINDRFGSINEVWDHCFKTAEYASKLAKLKNISTKDDVFFTAGLLHDIGKIVLMSFDKSKAKIIEKACHARGIDVPIAEEMMIGLSHSKIGGKIAEIWEFPQPLVDAISFHHDPIMANSSQDVVYTVFLANYIANLKNDESGHLYSIEPEIRSFFQIKSEEELNRIIDRVRQ